MLLVLSIFLILLLNTSDALSQDKIVDSTLLKYAQSNTTSEKDAKSIADSRGIEQRLTGKIGCLSSDICERCVSAHNELRALHRNTPGLIWDSNIALQAQRYAEKLLADNRGRYRTMLVHDSNSDLGENLYWSDKSAVATCAQACLSWYNEIDHYNYVTATSISQEPIGHFTQLVWVNSLRFGVGIASGTSRRFAAYGNLETFIVAKYSPRGNFHITGHRLEDYTANVKPKKTSVRTPTLQELATSYTTKIHPSPQCKNKIGEQLCTLLTTAGHVCSHGKYATYLQGNCRKLCNRC